MRLVKLTQAMKMEQPHLITGDKGAVLRLSHPAAQMVVALGNGVYADDGEEPGPTRAELEALETGTLRKIEDSGLELPEKRTVIDPAELVSDPEAHAEEEIKRPWGNAPKSAWVRYACAVDDKLTIERAEGLTKADLMSRYGERL